ncbi:MAG: hypothetical protein JO331_09400 [Verrucomicrobia bacterium]|nr:hypothetical protein [Verrucomicrobiota bacterium]
MTWLPDLVAAAGPRATDAYIEFFTATIRIFAPAMNHVFLASVTVPLRNG